MNTDFKRVLSWVRDKGYNYLSSADDTEDFAASEFIMVDLPVQLAHDLDDESNNQLITFTFNFEVNDENIKDVFISNMMIIPCTGISIANIRGEDTIILKGPDIKIFIR